MPRSPSRHAPAEGRNGARTGKGREGPVRFGELLTPLPSYARLLPQVGGIETSLGEPRLTERQWLEAIERKMEAQAGAYDKVLFTFWL